MSALSGTATIPLLALNVMMGGDLSELMAQHGALGLDALDLKTDVAGGPIEHCSMQQAQAIAAAAQEADLTVMCLSSCVGNASIDDGNQRLVEQTDRLHHLCSLVPILKPQAVRLIAARGDAAVVEDERIINKYRDWIQQLHETGVKVVIENEIGSSIGRDPHLVKTFFDNIGIKNDLGYIWDIANQWQEGRFPSLEDLHVLQPYISMLHVKGGRYASEETKSYDFADQLAHSDWPVTEICQKAIADCAQDLLAICINPPHGRYQDGWQYDLNNDVRFMKNVIADINREQVHV